MQENLSEQEAAKLDEWTKEPHKECRTALVGVMRKYKDEMIKMGITPNAFIATLIFDLIGSNTWNDDTFEAFLYVIRKPDFFPGLIQMLEEDGRITPGKHKAPLVI